MFSVFLAIDYDCSDSNEFGEALELDPVEYGSLNVSFLHWNISIPCFLHVGTVNISSFLRELM